MRYLYFCSLIFMFSTHARAQYVSIPDPEFVTYLQTNYPACMNGDQLDTTCSGILSVTHLSFEWVSVSNLDGLQYFDGLTNLRLTGIIKDLSIPAYPPSLITLECWSGSSNVVLGQVPPSLDTLSLDAVPYTHSLHDSLIYLAHTRGYSGYTLPANLKDFSCYNNHLTALPPLPASLLSLNCGYNLLTDLGQLPPQLTSLECSNNSFLTALPDLPATLEILRCTVCDFTALPDLPAGLKELSCYGNHLTVLPELPVSLETLMVIDNQLTALPALPAGLKSLYCSLNQLEVLPELPAVLIDLYCTNNELSELPALPESLKALFCSNNKLTSLPELPLMLDSLFCDHNQLSSLPALNTPSLGGLYCNGNNIKCLPFLPNSLMSLGIDSSITCIPNRPANPDFYGDYKICSDETSGCNVYPQISGYVYLDDTKNGTWDAQEWPYANARLRMEPGNYIMTTDSSGRYEVNVQAGTYTTSIHEEDLPFYTTVPGSISVTVAEYGEQSGDHNFALQTDEVINDLSVVLTPTGLIRPGRNAGYVLSYTNAGTTVLDGSVSLQYGSLLEAPVSKPLSDDVQDNLLTWNFTNLPPGQVRRIQVVFTLATTAQMNETVHLTASITPADNDQNPGDNSDEATQYVITSYDPNFKEVSPSKDLSPEEVLLQDPFTYTVHFQNTGNDTAFVVMIKDTISTNFEIGEIRTLAASHNYTFSMKNQVAVWKFNEILLPDSTKDEPNSHGFVKYRVIPKSTLVKNDRIENTAHIFFDYNIPVETNTTVNRVVDPTAVQEGTGQEVLNLYPNPTKGMISVALPGSEGQEGTVRIYNSQGLLIRSMDQVALRDLFTLDMSTAPKGMYYIQITGQSGRRTGKIELY